MRKSGIPNALGCRRTSSKSWISHFSPACSLQSAVHFLFINAHAFQYLSHLYVVQSVLEEKDVFSRAIHRLQCGRFWGWLVHDCSSLMLWEFASFCSVVIATVLFNKNMPTVQSFSIWFLFSFFLHWFSLKSDFVMWRGHLTKILCTPYSKDSWAMAVSLFHGTYFMSEVETEENEKRRKEMNEREKEMTYWGYKFEQYVTSGRWYLKKAQCSHLICCC